MKKADVYNHLFSVVPGAQEFIVGSGALTINQNTIQVGSGKTRVTPHEFLTLSLTQTAILRLEGAPLVSPTLVNLAKEMAHEENMAKRVVTIRQGDVEELRSPRR